MELLTLLTFGLCTTLAFTAISGLLLTHLYKREQQVIEERKDLMDRLMAKDFTEYKEATQPLVTFEPVSKSDADEFWDEVEARKV